MATHVGVLDHGRLVQFGSPREIYEQPVSIYAASRLGQPRINLLPADQFAGAPAGAVTMGLRPEQIRQGEGQEAMVQRVEHLGDQTRLHLTYRAHDLITVTDAHTALRAGDIIKIQPDRPFYFDKAGARIA
jgi:multiple sugar transport system ATP-binding protein